MLARTKGRKRAVDVLYEAEQRSAEPLSVLAEKVARNEPPVSEFAAGLVEGVTAHRVRIDDIIATYAVGWTLDRMPALDRAILRIGVYELLWCDEVPDAVAIDEAVALAKMLSTNESPRFVNGLLSRVQQEKSTLTV